MITPMDITYAYPAVARGRALFTCLFVALLAACSSLPDNNGRRITRLMPVGFERLRFPGHHTDRLW